MSTLTSVDVAHQPRKWKVATVSLAGCFGCHTSFLDIDERLLELIEHVEFDRSPLTDIKEVGPVRYRADRRWRLQLRERAGATCVSCPLQDTGSDGGVRDQWRSASRAKPLRAGRRAQRGLPRSSPA